MDFRNRGVQTPIAQAASTSSVGGRDSDKKGFNKWFSKGPVVLLILVGLLLAGVAYFTVFGGGGQAKLIDKSKYQAVFLNNGQVYFGKIKQMNDKYVNLDTIYYLQTNNNSNSSDSTAAANQNVTLVKLGCELHGPFDQMVINADQVLFWENLKDDSQVVTKIAEYNKSNPDRKCTAASSSTNQATSGASTQSPTGTGSSAQPSSSTKKP